VLLLDALLFDPFVPPHTARHHGRSRPSYSASPGGTTAG